MCLGAVGRQTGLGLGTGGAKGHQTRSEICNLRSFQPCGSWLTAQNGNTGGGGVWVQRVGCTSSGEERLSSNASQKLFIYGCAYGCAPENPLSFAPRWNCSSMQVIFSLLHAEGNGKGWNYHSQEIPRFLHQHQRRSPASKRLQNHRGLANFT